MNSLVSEKSKKTKVSLVLDGWTDERRKNEESSGEGDTRAKASRGEKRHGR